MPLPLRRRRAPAAEEGDVELLGVVPVDVVYGALLGVASADAVMMMMHSGLDSGLPGPAKKNETYGP